MLGQKRHLVSINSKLQQQLQDLTRDIEKVYCGKGMYVSAQFVCLDERRPACPSKKRFEKRRAGGCGAAERRSTYRRSAVIRSSIHINKLMISLPTPQRTCGQRQQSGSPQSKGIQCGVPSATLIHSCVWPFRFPS
jgi:hypothetical protein